MDISKRTYTTTIAIFQLLGAMISTLQTMQDTILILTLVIVTSTESHIATIESGLEHNTDRGYFRPDELEVYYEVLA